MNMLFKKEYLEHRFILILVLLLSLFFISGGLLLYRYQVDAFSGSPYIALQHYLRIFLWIVGYIICQRLFLKEYDTGSVLFIETLPIKQSIWLFQKWLFGLTAILLIVILCLSLSTMVAAFKEALSPRFIVIITSKTLVLTWFIYSYLFFSCLLGRYRFIFYFVSLLLPIFILDESMAFIHQPPFSLILQDKFLYERDLLPINDLMVTVVFGFLLNVSGFFMVLKQKMITRQLAQKMSLKENRVIVFIVIIIPFFLIQNLLSQKEIAYELNNAMTKEADGILIKIEKNNIDKQQERFLQATYSSLKQVKNYLKLAELPSLYILNSVILAPGNYETADIEDVDKLVIRINYPSEEWDQPHFMQWLIKEMLALRSHGRVKMEKYRWVYDGFPEFRDYNSLSSFQREQLGLRTQFGVKNSEFNLSLNQWFIYREQVGEHIASAVSGSILNFFKQQYGEQKTQQFLQLVLGKIIPENIFSVFHADNISVSHAFERTTGDSFDQFIKQWQNQLKQLLPQYQFKLQEIPEIEGKIAFMPITEQTLKVKYQLNVLNQHQPDRFRIFYQKLPFINQELSVKDNRVEERIYQPNQYYFLEENFQKNQKIAFAFEIYSETLGCHIMTGWKRRIIK